MGRLICSDDILAVAGNATSAELIPQDRVACPESGTMVLCSTVSATGVNARLIIGGDAVIDNEEIHLGVGVGTYVSYPADMMVSAKVKKGDVLSFKLDNVTGGSLNVAYKLFLFD